jgi:hypothetical protein
MPRGRKNSAAHRRLTEETAASATRQANSTVEVGRNHAEAAAPRPPTRIRGHTGRMAATLSWRSASCTSCAGSRHVLVWSSGTGGERSWKGLQCPIFKLTFRTLKYLSFVHDSLSSTITPLDYIMMNYQQCISPCLQIKIQLSCLAHLKVSHINQTFLTILRMHDSTHVQLMIEPKDPSVPCSRVHT